MADEKLWFQQAVEGLLVQALGARLTPTLKSELKARGLDVARLRPAYTHEEVVDALNIVARGLWPGRPAADSLFELGSLAFRGFSTTFLGAAAVAFMKLVGADRAFARTQRGFQAAANYVRVESLQPEPHRWHLVARGGAELAPFVAGVLSALVSDIGGGRLAFRHELEPDGTVLVFIG